jgi:predicted aspartyl protease
MNEKLERIITDAKSCGSVGITSGAEAGVSCGRKSSPRNTNQVLRFAIVGLDLLGRQNLRIDYRHRRLEIGGSITKTETVPFELRQEAGGTYIVIPLDAGGEKLRMLFDTGTKDLMLLQSHLRGGLSKLRLTATAINVNAGGEDRIVEVELASVTIGPLVRKRQKAYIWSASDGSDRAFDGLLGPAVFQPALVQVDFERREIAFGY